jgi:hypothetical protein
LRGQGRAPRSPLERQRAIQAARKIVAEHNLRSETPTQDAIAKLVAKQIALRRVRRNESSGTPELSRTAEVTRHDSQWVCDP